jgi:hypothetical protein
MTHRLKAGIKPSKKNFIPAPPTHVKPEGTLHGVNSAHTYSHPAKNIRSHEIATELVPRTQVGRTWLGKGTQRMRQPPNNVGKLSVNNTSKTSNTSNPRRASRFSISGSRMRGVNAEYANSIKGSNTNSIPRGTVKRIINLAEGKGSRGKKDSQPRRISRKPRRKLFNLFPKGTTNIAAEPKQPEPPKQLRAEISTLPTATAVANGIATIATIRTAQTLAQSHPKTNTAKVISQAASSAEGVAAKIEGNIGSGSENTVRGVGAPPSNAAKSIAASVPINATVKEPTATKDVNESVAPAVNGQKGNAAGEYMDLKKVNVNATAAKNRVRNQYVGGILGQNTGTYMTVKEEPLYMDTIALKSSGSNEYLELEKAKSLPQSPSGNVAAPAAPAAPVAAITQVAPAAPVEGEYIKVNGVNPSKAKINAQTDKNIKVKSKQDPTYIEVNPSSKSEEQQFTINKEPQSRTVAAQGNNIPKNTYVNGESLYADPKTLRYNDIYETITNLKSQYADLYPNTTNLMNPTNLYTGPNRYMDPNPLPPIYSNNQKKKPPPLPPRRNDNTYMRVAPQGKYMDVKPEPEPIYMEVGPSSKSVELTQLQKTSPPPLLPPPLPPPPPPPPPPKINEQQQPPPPPPPTNEAKQPPPPPPPENVAQKIFAPEKVEPLVKEAGLPTRPQVLEGVAKTYGERHVGQRTRKQQIAAVRRKRKLEYKIKQAEDNAKSSKGVRRWLIQDFLGISNPQARENKIVEYQKELVELEKTMEGLNEKLTKKRATEQNRVNRKTVKRKIMERKRVIGYYNRKQELAKLEMMLMNEAVMNDGAL